ALTVAESVGGPDGWEVAALLNDLAVLHKFQGRFAEAGRLYRSALKLLERALGPDHPELATLYHNLGGLEHARRRFARGEPFARRALALREQRWGPTTRPSPPTPSPWPPCSTGRESSTRPSGSTPARS